MMIMILFSRAESQTLNINIMFRLMLSEVT